MDKVQIRLSELGDAQRFYEILNNPHFIYFNVKPASVEAELAWLHQSLGYAAAGTSYNYAILYEGQLVGGVGVKMDGHCKKVGEIGYFVDEAYWGKGIATAAVKILEQKCFQEYGLTRVEIVMRPENVASEQVAIKAGYIKEGVMQKAIEGQDQEGMVDAYLYAKVL